MMRGAGKAMAKKIIAVYGSSGSYKTTTAIALAHYISKTDPGANIILVGTDTTKPILPLIAPNEKKFKGSIGYCLSAVSFEQDILFKNMYIATDKIGVLGYNIRENANTYPIVSSDRIDDMYTVLRQSADYTIVDCTSDITSARLTSQAIIKADNTIELITADLNGVVFNSSQESVLQSEQYRYRSFIRLVSLDNRFSQDVNAVKAALGAISGEMPCCTKAAEAFNQGTLITNGVSDRTYNNVLKSIYKLIEED